jgi:hypothetical protein
MPITGFRSGANAILSWVHFGDLHVTHEDKFESAEKLQVIVDTCQVTTPTTVRASNMALSPTR